MHRYRLSCALALLLFHAAPVSASMYIDMSLYPRRYDRPDQPIEVYWSISADSCPGGGYAPVYVLDSLITSDAGFIQWQGAAIGGSVTDAGYKPKGMVTYTLDARIICSNVEGIPNWDLEYSFQQSVSAYSYTTPVSIQYIPELPPQPMWRPVGSGVTCTVPDPDETGGFTYYHWAQHWQVFDGWQEPFFDHFETIEYSNFWYITEPHCDLPPPQSDWGDWTTSVWDDNHIVSSFFCCDQSTCMHETNAEWQGRSAGTGAFTWVVQAFHDSCFAHQVLWMWIVI